MYALSYAYFAHHLNQVFDVMIENDPVVVACDNGKNMVLLPESECNSIIETMRILNFPIDAHPLPSALQDSLSGNMRPFELMDASI